MAVGAVVADELADDDMLVAWLSADRACDGRWLVECEHCVTVTTILAAFIDDR
jgi:hypothetical protein